MRKLFDVGRLNKRITFMKFQTAKDAMGQNVQKLMPIKEVWASFYPIRGSEFYESKRLEGKTYYRCYCRYNKDIDSNCFIRFEGKDFHIESVIDVNLEHKMLEISCIEYLGKERL